jgi:hypothetical protein
MKKKLKKIAVPMFIVRTAGEGRNFGPFKSTAAAELWALKRWKNDAWGAVWMILPLVKP